MEAMKAGSGASRRISMAVDLFWFGMVSVLAGLAAAIMVAAMAMLLAQPARAQSEMPLGGAGSGSLMVKTDQPGLYRPLPTLKTDVTIRATGIVARATVTQRFQNTTSSWIEAVYVFPLPENAAVDHMRMRVGERVIEGEIREREAARKTFEQAKHEGRRTTLIEQERANIFTNNVANIGPNETVTVELEYQQTLRYEQGAFRLRFPMVVAPRYIPGESVPGGAGTGWARNTDKVPDASRITPPVPHPSQAPLNPVALRVVLDAGFPLARIESPHHPVRIQQSDDGKRTVTLRDGEVPAGRDFELVWSPEAGKAPGAAVFTEARNGHTYALLMLMPPHEKNTQHTKTPREAIFVIDTSGSMTGTSMEQAREALLLALDRLTPADRFNVIQFNSTTDVLFREARRADADALGEARRYVRNLKAQGGTEMAGALRAALDGRRDAEMLRQVVFLTDGAVGNEDELFRIIAEKLGASRLFTVGIGSAPNGHFMTKAAQFGKGGFTYIGNVSEVRQKMGELFEKLENPVLSDITVQWPGGAPAEMWPAKVPDLYSGEPIMLSVRLSGVQGQLTVAGKGANEPWRMSVPLKPVADKNGVAVLWARHKIGALMDEMRTGAPDSKRDAIVTLALEHHLVSKYTSLVAVDVTPVRREGTPLQTAAMPTRLPEGWDHAAVFGALPQTATPRAMHTLIGALMLLLSALCWVATKRDCALARGKD